MIDFLFGRAAAAGEDYVVTDVCGVGYGITMTTGAVKRISGEKEPIRIYTHMVIREDVPVLYGFLDTGERELFRLLISVNRVGPQLAISVLSQIPAGELALAISAEDEKRLTRLSGLGPRNAKRIILELKDKAGNIFPASGIGNSPVSGEICGEAAAALVHLGFSSKESRDAVNRAATGMVSADTAALIRAALGLLKEKKKS
jgi:holliday junction DNA helicase RuvA